jgi:tetratricopeptide (TPR) repeat protein
MTSRRPCLALLALAALVLTGPALRATCGGGGGGGEGGFGDMGAVAPVERVYHVPWSVLRPADPPPTTDLVLFWFPVSPEEARVSPLQSSRRLTSWAGECVGMAIVTTDNAPLREKFHAAADAPLAVLAAADGSEVARVDATAGRLELSAVEKAVSGALDRREDDLAQALDQAHAKSEAGDADGAAALYQRVYDQRCTFPSLAKKAAKALDRMGRPVPAASSSLWDGARPDLAEPTNTRMVELLASGLTAELDGRMMTAQGDYEKARDLDPGDPVPLRFLGELHRHHTGDWAEARRIFSNLLARPTDPLTRAVALHGLGKMTIHEGQFARGLELFEQSIAVYPLALTYRNLAVYWASEHQPQKAWGYVERALALAPDDPYNQVFAATQSVVLGHAKEAEALALQNEGMLSASYNLAAIHAQLGHRDKALELLRRHFYVYEKTDAVRRREMQEARDDVVFERYHRDPAFVKLTALADGMGGAMPSKSSR